MHVHVEQAALGPRARRAGSAEAREQEERGPVAQRVQGQGDVLRRDHAGQRSAGDRPDRVRRKRLGGEQVEGDPLDPGDVPRRWVWSR